MLNKTNNTTINAVASVLVSGVFASVGCTFVNDDASQSARPIIAFNGYYFQSFGLNPTDENGLSVGAGTALHSVALDGLQINGRGNTTIKVNGQDLSAEQEVMFDKLFGYLTECALAPGQSVSLTMSNGTVETYEGVFALGTEWATGPLSPAGQTNVSACVAARTNGQDEHVKISMRGNNLVTSATELRAFPTIEGAFWGNAFGDDPQIYTCSADISGIAGRECATGSGSCGFIYAGECSVVCDQDPNDGHFSNCLGATDVITVALPYTKNAAFSGDHSCVAEANGILNCWGDNDLGQVGDGTNAYRLLPVSVTMATNNAVVEVAGGSNHSCARQADGTVTCWGDNSFGQLGADSTAASANDPAQVASLVNNAMSLVSGANHVCALAADATVLCWGKNTDGQLGDSTTTNSNLPVVAATNVDVVRLATSSDSDHTCALTDGGAVFCWGDNTFGQLGDSTTTDQSTPVLAQSAASSVIDLCTGAGYTCTLGADGSGSCFGSVTASTTQTATTVECSATSVCFSGANGTECF